MNEACYIYCITEGELDDLELTGVDGEKVYTIKKNNIRIVVHNCCPLPYEGEDNEVKKWVIQHNRVVEKIWERQNTVLPLTFDTIIKGGEEKSVRDNVLSWVETHSKSIKNNLKKFKKRAEYIIQIIINNKEFFKQDNKNILSKEVKEEELTGLAYLKKKKAKRQARDSIKNKIEDLKQSCYLKISNEAKDIIDNKCKPVERPEQMILNISILSGDKEVKNIGDLLEKINNRDGVRVRFTGPWPCYSFINNFYENK